LSLGAQRYLHVRPRKLAPVAAVDEPAVELHDLGRDYGERAALRGVELGAEVILKATKVDGIYSADPLKDSKAERYRTLSYMDVLNRGLTVMDNTAITMCMDNNLPIIVFDLMQEGNIEKVVLGEEIGTLVYGR